MDSNTLIYSAVFLALIAFVAFIAIRNQKNKHNEAKDYLQKVVSEKGCTILQEDYWKGLMSRTSIAIDTNKSMLFFVREIDKKPVTTAIDLSEIKRSMVSTTSRSAGEGKNRQTVIDAIRLDLINKARDKADATLEFYNNEYDNLHLTQELQLAEKWSAIINEAIGCK